MKYLEQHGVEPDRMRLSEAAASEPVTNRIESAWQKENSRVEVFLLNELVDEQPGMQTPSKAVGDSDKSERQTTCNQTERARRQRLGRSDHPPSQKASRCQSKTQPHRRAGKCRPKARPSQSRKRSRLKAVMPASSLIFTQRQAGSRPLRGIPHQHDTAPRTPGCSR